MEFLKAFLVGGAICLVGQLLIDLTKLTPARILTGFVVAGVILSAVGLYAPIAEFGGAGATVPIIGFGHLLFEGVKNAVSEKGPLGVVTGGITAASGGIAMSLMMGLLVAALFRSKDQS
jgi:stage V sporulation protein AE